MFFDEFDRFLHVSDCDDMVSVVVRNAQSKCLGHPAGASSVSVPGRVWRSQEILKVTAVADERSVRHGSGVQSTDSIRQAAQRTHPRFYLLLW